MNGARKPNAMLIELVIVILFFSISAGIILQLFVAAHDRSMQSDTDTAALLLSEDMAERFAASDLPLDAFLDADGWTSILGNHEKTLTPDGARPLRMALDGSTLDMGPGALDTLTLTVYDGERVCVTLPINRYTAREGMP